MFIGQLKKMKFTLLVITSVVVGITVAELPLAVPCDHEACQLPDCRCSGIDIPGGLAARDTPQFVLLTFDDGVNVINIETYRTYNNRFNSNGCKTGVTYYVSHEYTSYVLCNELYNEGNEIALHSISHRTPPDYWATADFPTMMKEIGDQREQMAHFANIPVEEIKGVRMPFLQMAGNSSFQAMNESGLIYDCSWGTTNNVNPGLWPYTLDYASTQECLIPPCPTASIPGVWVIPMVSWFDLENNPCVMVDSCFIVPPHDDEEAWYRFIVHNFERHFLGNRAPFGFYIHEWYLRANPHVKSALDRFLDQINQMNDVFMVTSKEVIDWVRNPVPINEYREQTCRTFQQTTCPALSCGPLSADHNNIDYWMAVCTACPRVYPWVSNPFGL